MVEVLAEQVLDFTYSSDYEAYINNSNPSLFLPEVGKTYKVTWDGTEYNCVAFTNDSFANQIMLGNTVLIGGEDTGVPFTMSYISDGSGMTIFSFDEGDTHTMSVHLVGISIILYDRTGQAILKEGVITLTTDTPEAGETALFTHGEAIENAEYELSMAEGNQKVTLDEGSLLKEFTLIKPASLLPEYIKKGIDIAGVTGNFAGDVAEKTVELNMAEGDQVIEADEDTVLTKVTVVKPETLAPKYIAEGVNIGGIVGTYGASSFNSTDANLRYFTYQLDMENKLIYLYSVLYSKLFEDFGSYDVNVPDKLGGFDVVIAYT